MFNNNEEVREQLPAIAINDIVPLPSAEIRVDLNQNEDVKAIKAAEQYRNYVVVLLNVNKDVKEETLDKYYKRGVVARVVLNMTNPNGTRRVKLQIITRCNINEFTLTNPYLVVDFTTCPSVSSNPDSEIATLNLIKDELVSNNKLMPVIENRDAILTALRKDIQTAEFSDIIAYNLTCDYKNHLKYLFELDTTKRLVYILEDLRKQKYFNELELKMQVKY